MTTFVPRLLLCWLLLGALVPGIGTATEEDGARRTLVDFAVAGEDERWRIVNDGVMGGISSSRFSATADGTAVFEGTVSLENNGGFASVRRSPADYRLSGATGVELRVRGDGKRYQLRLRTDDRFDGAAWQASFETTAGEWTVVRVPFDAFVATFRGFAVRDAGRLDPARVRQVGFLIADKQVGGFRLEIGAIGAY